MGTSNVPIPQAQTNRLGSALGGAGLGYLGGQFLGGTTFGFPSPLVGAGVGVSGLLDSAGLPGRTGEVLGVNLEWYFVAADYCYAANHNAINAR